MCGRPCAPLLVSVIAEAWPVKAYKTPYRASAALLAVLCDFLVRGLFSFVLSAQLTPSSVTMTLAVGLRTMKRSIVTYDAYVLRLSVKAPSEF